MKQLLLSLAFTILSLGAWAQIETANLDVALEQAQDYKEQETLVIDCINWWQTTPVGEQADLRKKVNAFLFRWMSGSPTVSLELREEFLAPDCPECLMAFMAGWTKYSLENNYAKDQVACTLAGIVYTIDFYEKNRKHLAKNNRIQQFIKMQKKGKLESYIQSKF